MSKTTSRTNSDAPLDWHPAFLLLLPSIERQAHKAFANLKYDTHDEAVQEVVCNACVAYARLAERGKTHVASATSLAKYAVAQVRSGRKVGTRMNVRDIGSDYCQLHKGVHVEPLIDRDCESGVWQEILVEDKNVTPAELAASRIDYALFLSTLPLRQRRIAETLAAGETTTRAAKRFRLSAARISQIRRELKSAWEDLHAPKAAAAMA